MSEVDADVKLRLYLTAFSRMDRNLQWGNRLTQNCLPACMCILEDVKDKWSKAHIVIGDISVGPEPKDLCALESGILDFLKPTTNKLGIPKFHAWIELGNGDRFDVVGGTWLAEHGYTQLNSLSYIDADIATEQNVHYFSVLTDPEHVDDFYHMLRVAHGKSTISLAITPVETNTVSKSTLSSKIRHFFCQGKH